MKAELKWVRVVGEVFEEEREQLEESEGGAVRKCAKKNVQK